MLDGDGPARFLLLPPPKDEDVESILRRVIRRTAKALVGYDEELESEADALAALQAAEVDRRLRYRTPFLTSAAAPSSTASRSTPASGSTRTTAKGAKGSADTFCVPRSRSTGCHRPKTAGSSTA